MMLWISALLLGAVHCAPTLYDNHQESAGENIDMNVEDSAIIIVPFKALTDVAMSFIGKSAKTAEGKQMVDSWLDKLAKFNNRDRATPEEKVEEGSGVRVAKAMKGPMPINSRSGKSFDLAKLLFYIDLAKKARQEDHRYERPAVQREYEIFNRKEVPIFDGNVQINEIPRIYYKPNRIYTMQTLVDPQVEQVEGSDRDLDNEGVVRPSPVMTPPDKEEMPFKHISMEKMDKHQTSSDVMKEMEKHQAETEEEGVSEQQNTDEDMEDVLEPHGPGHQEEQNGSTENLVLIGGGLEQCGPDGHRDEKGICVYKTTPKST